jgi:hypothetical protein
MKQPEMEKQEMEQQEMAKLKSGKQWQKTPVAA